MKKSLLLAALFVMIIAAGCKKKDPLDPNSYVGKFYVVSTGSADYIDDNGATQKIPLVLGDTINISLDPSNSNGLICSGKIFSGNATVTENGIKFNDVTYIKEGEGTAYSYSLNLKLTNEYAKLSNAGLILTWKSTVTGSASAGTIGVGVEKSVTGTLTNIGTKKL